MELSFQLFRSLWFWSGIYLVGKDTVPQYWKLCYQQWSRNWLFYSGKGPEARWSAFSIFVRGCSWNSCLVIRQNPEIINIKIVGEETKLLQYADDTTAVLSDINSAQALFNLLEVFNNLSGLVINSSKTERKWIGSSRDKTSKPFGMKWPDEPIKALGVYCSYDINLLHEIHFIERLDSVKKRINIWSSRGFYLWKSNNYQVFNHNQEALRPIRFLNFMNQNPEIDGRYFLIAENRNQKSEIGNRKSEIGNRKSEIGNQKSEIRNQKSVCPKAHDMTS